jgi:hypothetical protein|tara:strand:- start:254 stop:577 length:324 start_codon:yes stop_codon:yes gene_type:complete
MKNFLEWLQNDFLEWLSVHGTIQFWIFLILSLAGNVYQYAFYKGYDQNVGIVIEAYSEEQLENFDLNRAIHEKNLLIFDLDWKLKECISILNIAEEEGAIAVEHLLE